MMQELRVAQKMEEVIRYGYVAVARFPKSERHVLSQELRTRMWRILELIVICAKRYHKKTTLQELDAEIEMLRRQIRIAVDLGYLPFRQYETWARHLNEVGAMVGAWIKQARG